MQENCALPFDRHRLSAQKATERSPKLSSISNFRNQSAVIFAVALLFLTPDSVQAKINQKKNSAQSDGLADYVQRFSTKGGDPVPTTSGSLWSDSGRLANMVADYKASRVGDLVTINVTQNLSATSTGNVSTNRSYAASTGIAALPGQLKTAGVANLFAPSSTEVSFWKSPGYFADFVEYDAYRTSGRGFAHGNPGGRSRT